MANRTSHTLFISSLSLVENTSLVTHAALEVAVDRRVVATPVAPPYAPPTRHALERNGTWATHHTLLNPRVRSTAADETRFCHSAPPRAPPDDTVATKPPRRRPGTEERPRGWRPTSTVAWRRARPALPRRPAAPRHQNESTSAPAATTSPCSCSRSCLRVMSLG